MIALELVRKRKIRKIAAIVAFIGFGGVGSLGIISFLGRFVGTFTVTVDNGEVALSLDEKLAFENPQSYLRINKLPPYVETTEVHRLVNLEDLENEENDYTFGMRTSPTQDGDVKEVMHFFKYTFYVKNVGATRAKYNISVNILENKPTQEDTPRYLDTTLRVMIFDHDSADDSHDYTIYAKPTTKGLNYLADGVTKTNREFVADPPKNVARVESERYPLAEPFVSADTIARYDVPDFGPQDIRRYTLVTWLEGSDPDSTGSTPLGASIRLGVEINAYEN